MSEHFFMLDKYMVMKDSAGGSKWHFVQDPLLRLSIVESPVPMMQVSITKKLKQVNLV
jgi:hypothetical protein